MRGRAETPSLLGTEMTDWRLISFQSPYSSLLNRQTDRQRPLLSSQRRTFQELTLPHFTPSPATHSGVPRANFIRVMCYQGNCNFKLMFPHRNKTLYCQAFLLNKKEVYYGDRLCLSIHPYVCDLLHGLLEFREIWYGSAIEKIVKLCLS